MKRLGLVIVFVFPLSLLASGFAVAADDSKVKSATNQVESGAKKVSDGKVGEGRGAAREDRVGQRARRRRRVRTHRQGFLYESLLEVTS